MMVMNVELRRRNVINNPLLLLLLLLWLWLLLLLLLLLLLPLLLLSSHTVKICCCANELTLKSFADWKKLYYEIFLWGFLKFPDSLIIVWQRKDIICLPRHTSLSSYRRKLHFWYYKLKFEMLVSVVLVLHNSMAQYVKTHKLINT